MTVEDAARRHVRTMVRGGFLPAHEIEALTVELLSDDYDMQVVPAVVASALTEELAAHAAEQASWPPVTDCDRLDKAFAALDARGIAARQNFSCCGNCGSGEIWAEVDALAKIGVTPRGYTFFHSQDTDSAADGYRLFVHYGSVEEGEAPALAVGHEIVEVLNSHGLATVWDGRWSNRIEILVRWQRRRSPAQHPQEVA